MFVLTIVLFFTGLPEGASKKSRSYLLLQRLPATLHGEEEEEENLEEEEENLEGEGEEDAEEGPQVETDSQVSARTQQSQLSYKAMTPQAPPLPVGLALTRESAMMNGRGDNSQGGGGGGAVEPPLVQSRPSSGQQPGSRPVSASRAPRPPSQQAARPGSTTSQGRRPPSQVSMHSRGKESETGQASIEEETAVAGEAKEEGGEGEEPGEASRGDEPEIEQLNRQGEMQRGDDRVLEDKEAQAEEKEKDETEEEAAAKAQRTAHTPTPPTDAGAGHHSRGHTPHPGDMPPRGPSAGSRTSAGQRRRAEPDDDQRAEEPQAEPREDVQTVPAVKEDKAGRGGQAEAAPEPQKEEEKPSTGEQQRATSFTERAEDSLHVEADMKAKVSDGGDGDGAATDGSQRPPTQPGSKPTSRPPSQGSKASGSRPPTQPSDLGSRPGTQSKK